MGWKISETNLTTGGLFGYSSEKVSRSWKSPPSHGVFSGPEIVACQKYRFDSSIRPLEIPWG